MGDDVVLMNVINTPANDGNQAICFDAELVGRYDGRGPRYTSYPTALQFDDTFGPEDYSETASASNLIGHPLSIYVHVPFCTTLCYYCGCNKIVTRNADRVHRYLDCLRDEIRMQSELFDKRRVVEQLHLGGGTPTYLDDRQLGELMTWLSTGFQLESGAQREFSIEIDPRSVHDQSLELLAKLGFNRVSLGIQDFDPNVQRAVNRIQSVDDVANIVDDAQRYGYRSVSFDLIYGLPHQSVATFDRTLDQVIEMRPDRLAIYNYAHLPARFKGQRMINERDLPSAAVKLEILQHTIQKLVNSGYVYIGMDHFALPDDDLTLAKRDGSLQRNFQGYSTHGGCDLVSLGVSAISKIGNSYAQNAVSTIEYEQLIGDGILPVKKGLLVDDDDLLRAEVIQDVMCHDGIDFESFEKAHGIRFHDHFAAELNRLRLLDEDGLIGLNERGIQVTPKGRLLLRCIAMVFDRHLPGNSSDSRFSRAI